MQVYANSNQYVGPQLFKSSLYPNVAIFVVFDSGEDDPNGETDAFTMETAFWDLMTFSKDPNGVST